MSDRPLVIYHGKCADGFTAAWIANRYFRTRKDSPLPADDNGWAVDAIPAVYGEMPPDVTGRVVYIVDFSYPREVILAMAGLAKRITIIDHHKTAIENLEGVAQEAMKRHPACPVVTQFSVERSGAWLTWEYFFTNDRHNPVPDLVALVDDRDRWVFKDKRSRPFAAGLFARGYTIDEWDEAATAEGLAKTIEDGEAIERKQQKDISELLDVMTVWQVIAGEAVPTANLSYMSASDACVELLRRHPDAKFAATWFLRTDGRRVYSLRSRQGSDVDVGNIARMFGGGGHMHASGFTLTPGNAFAIVDPCSSTNQRAA